MNVIPHLQKPHLYERLRILGPQKKKKEGKTYQVQIRNDHAAVVTVGTANWNELQNEGNFLQHTHTHTNKFKALKRRSRGARRMQTSRTAARHRKFDIGTPIRDAGPHTECTFETGTS